MLEFVDSTDLLDEPSALRARFAGDGYVFLKGRINRELLLEVRDRITRICAANGWFVDGTDPMDAIAGDRPCVEGDKRFFDVYDEVQKLEVFHAVPHDPSVRSCMEALLGDSAFPHPLSIARLIFPQYESWTTPPHQDHPNNQGTEDLYACWVPLSSCPVELGGLSILRGSHRFGVVPLQFSLGAGNRRAALDERFAHLEWVGGDFELGDAVVFHSLAVHRALPNTTGRMRLSVDYRFQRQSEPLTAECLLPHFKRLCWDEVYAGWSRTDLQYYWLDKDYTVVPWDHSFHELSEEELAEALPIVIDSNREREARFSSRSSPERRPGLFSRLRPRRRVS